MSELAKYRNWDQMRWDQMRWDQMSWDQMRWDQMSVTFPYFLILRPMKRNSGNGFQDGSGKRQRFNELGFNEALDQGKYALRLLIPTRAAGSVIGKGGENINTLSQKYEASMSVPDRNTPERVLTIVCSKESIGELFKEVIHILLQDQKAKNEARMLVHQSHVGQIMGKAGANVKELGGKTKTQITIFKEICPMSTDRVVLISGAEQNIAEAVQSLINDLSAIPVKSVEHPYDPANYDPGAAHVYGGFSGGGVGSTRKGGDPRGPRNDYNQGPGHYDSYGGGVASWHGPPARSPMGNSAGGYQGAEAYPSNAGYGRPQAQSNMVYPEDYLRGAEAVQMAIPRELCGKIFGNNGELVHTLMKECGSRIDVGITISGRPQQIEMTQNMLKQMIRKPAPSAAPAGHYMDEGLMNGRAEAAQFAYGAPTENSDFMAKYKL
uniref:K Homology domain-containing protein n=1 Tax=Ditylenchus dipsaci TaxID=166011 RepID=A0A915E5M2_9BILA